MNIRSRLPLDRSGKTLVESSGGSNCPPRPRRTPLSRLAVLTRRGTTSHEHSITPFPHYRGLGHSRRSRGSARFVLSRLPFLPGRGEVGPPILRCPGFPPFCAGSPRLRPPPQLPAAARRP